jgi:hypothetical protein
MTQGIYTHTDLNSEEFLVSISHGHASIRFNVVGYWSEVIHLTVARNYFNADSDCKRWGIRVNHSSGGRDTEVVESDIVAERNMGMALIAAANLAEQLTQRFAEFEQMYQQRAKIYRIERETAELALQKKIDDDAPIGMDYAEEIMQQLDSNYSITIQVFNRGEDDFRSVTFSTNRRGRKVYRMNGEAKDRNYILTYIAERSARSTIAV